jgi:hypothetical protein
MHALDATPPAIAPADTVHTADTPADTAVAAAVDTAVSATAATRPLRGRHVALLALDLREPAARAALRHAEALGARVSPLQRPATDARFSDDVLWVIGRLYDGVICAGLPPARMAALRAAIDKPVLDAAAASREALLAALG